MNARQKAKKYKKELNRLRKFLDPGKVVYTAVYEDVRPISYKSMIDISYRELDYLLGLQRENVLQCDDVIKDKLLEPLINNLKDNMEINVVRDDVSQVAHCRCSVLYVLKSESEK